MRRREWLALPLLLRAAGERFRLQRRSGRWMFVSPEGRPFFPLWGGNARREDLALLEARRWPEVIPSPPA